MVMKMLFFYREPATPVTGIHAMRQRPPLGNGFNYQAAVSSFNFSGPVDMKAGCPDLCLNSVFRRLATFNSQDVRTIESILRLDVAAHDPQRHTVGLISGRVIKLAG
jgi:hypothetical protein